MHKPIIFISLLSLSISMSLTSCTSEIVPGSDLSGQNLHGRNFDGVDLTGVNLSNTDLQNASFGLSDRVKPCQSFSNVGQPQLLLDNASVAFIDGGKVKVVDIRTKKEASKNKIPANLSNVVISPDGKKFVIETSGLDGSISITDMATNVLTPTDANTYSSLVYGPEKFSPDGHYFVIHGDQSTLIWDSIENSLAFRVYSTTSAETWFKNSNTLVFKSWKTDSLELWDADSGLQDTGITVPSNVNGELLELAPDNRSAAMFDTIIPDGESQGFLFDLESGTHLGYFENLTASGCENCNLTTIAWSPTRQLIAGGTDSGKIVFWDVETGVILHSLKMSNKTWPVDTIQWSGDGSFLLSSQSGNLSIWNSDELFRTTILDNTNLSNADLSEANLAGTDLRKANLTGTNFSGANLQGARLTGLDLRGANFSNSDLRGTDLSDANLSGANLSGALINGVNLENTLLAGADISGVQPMEYLLKPVCFGTGIDSFPAYSSSEGIHPLIILDSNGKIHKWDKEVLETWHAGDDQLPELAVCVGDFYTEKYKTCSYGFSGISNFSQSVALLQGMVDITLRDIHTGEVIGRETIKQEVGECPKQVEINTDSIGGRPPESTQALDLLREYIEK